MSVQARLVERQRLLLELQQKKQNVNEQTRDKEKELLRQYQLKKSLVAGQVGVTDDGSVSYSEDRNWKGKS